MAQQILEALIELQEIDCKIYELDQQKQLKPVTLLVKQKEIDQKRLELEAYKNELKKNKIKTNEKELTLKEKEEKVAKLNIQLNTVKTNKEYAALMSEIAGHKAEISKLEDEILLFFTQMEELQKKIQILSEEINMLDKEFLQLKEKVETEINLLDKELAHQREQRRVVTEKIPPEVLGTYNKIIAHKPDKIALAAVVDAICQGCFMDLSPQEINELLKGKEIIYCRNCSRMLYLKTPIK